MTMDTINTINPATGELIHAYETMSEDHIDNLINYAHDSFIACRHDSLASRSAKMHKAAKILLENKLEYAKIITQEMGKPITQAIGEIEKCALVCNYYADNADAYLEPKHIKTEMSKSYIVYRPMGIIFAIMPWNFPFWQVLRFAAPNLMVGNAAILKHAPISTGTALAIEKIFLEAGFAKGLFSSVIVDTDLAGKIIDHPNVRGVTITGSSRAGMAVASQAGAALKKSVLELGGSDPYLILEDNDDAALEAAAKLCVDIRMKNSGQVCISPKRVIVVDKVREKFTQLALEQMQAYKPGDPMDEDCNFGPMARSDLRDELDNQVKATIASGAKCLIGGEPVAGPGFYYQSTMLTDIPKDSVAYSEELFGPVFMIIPAKDEADAINIANSSCYGLAGAVFTQDIERGQQIAENEIITGACAVNTFVASDPRMPFGGTKSSGYGRELGSYGIHEFTNIKTIMVK